MLTPNEQRTGTLLACYGIGFISWVISFFARDWRHPFRKGPSHVATLVLCKRGDDKELAWVFHSTTQMGEPDAWTGEKHAGIQVQKLADFLEAYNGKVVLYPLKTPMTDRGGLHAIQYAVDTHKRQVEYDHKQAAGGSLPILNTENGEKLYCSEFLAFFLQKGGSIRSGINASSQRPRHSIAYPCYDQKRKRVLKG